MRDPEAVTAPMLPNQNGRSHRLPRQGNPHLATPIVSTIIAVATLVLLGFLLAPALDIWPDPDEFRSTLKSLIPNVAAYTKPEPLERNLFISLTLISPLIVIVSSMGGLRLVHKLRRWTSSTSTSERYAILKHLLCITLGVLTVVILPGRTELASIFFPDTAQKIIGCLLLGMTFLAIHVFSSTRRYHSSLTRRIAICITVSFAIFVAILPRGLSIHSLSNPDDVTPLIWAVPFQAVFYGVTQAAAGKAILSTPPLYGLYGAILAPVFHTIGLSIFKFCLVMDALLCLGILAVFRVLSLNVRQTSILFLGSATLIYCLGGTWSLGGSGFDPYFQYFPVRFVFPACSIPFFFWAIRKTDRLALAAFGLFVGFGLVWNMESGIAVLAASLFSLAATAARKVLHRGGNQKATIYILKEGIPLAIVGSIAIATFCLFMLFVRTTEASSGTPKFHTTGDFQRVFFGIGFNMLPMPMTIHPWWFVIAIYLFALTFGISSILAGRRGSPPIVSLYLAILGVGLFTYYQGRSHDVILPSVAWPSILLAFIFCDRLLRAIRLGLIPKYYGSLALPTVYIGIMSAVMFSCIFPGIWRSGSKRWREALSDNPNTTIERVAFIQKMMNGKGRQAAILARFQAIFFAETGLQSELDGPGVTELFFRSDVAAIRNALASRSLHHVFVDTDVIAQLDLSEALRGNYKVVACSPDKQFAYMEPLLH